MSLKSIYTSLSAVKRMTVLFCKNGNPYPRRFEYKFECCAEHFEVLVLCLRQPLKGEEAHLHVVQLRLDEVQVGKSSKKLLERKT